MKKDKIIKIVMSAAFMATVTTLPAWAEGMEAETTEELAQSFLHNSGPPAQG